MLVSLTSVDVTCKLMSYHFQCQEGNLPQCPDWQDFYRMFKTICNPRYLQNIITFNFPSDSVTDVRFQPCLPLFWPLIIPFNIFCMIDWFRLLPAVIRTRSLFESAATPYTCGGRTSGIRIRLLFCKCLLMSGNFFNQHDISCSIYLTSYYAGGEGNI